MSSRTVPVALAVITAGGLTVAAQRVNPPVTLAGQVVDAVSGAPIAGVRLDLRAVLVLSRRGWSGRRSGLTIDRLTRLASTATRGTIGVGETTVQPLRGALPQRDPSVH